MSDVQTIQDIGKRQLSDEAKFPGTGNKLGSSIEKEPTSKAFKKFGEANIQDLCEYVGAKMPAKWKEFGICVGVEEGDLEAIEAGWPKQQNGFTTVFQKWHDGMTSDYTWEKVAEALESKAVGEKGQLKGLYAKLSKAKGGTNEELTSKDFKQFGEPNLKDLCEYVGAKIRHKWKEFGRFVRVKEGDLEAIEVNESDWHKKCFTTVFQKWHNGMTSDYTWEKVAEALESVAVGKKGLLKDLYDKLETKMTLD